MEVVRRSKIEFSGYVHKYLWGEANVCWTGHGTLRHVSHVVTYSAHTYPIYAVDPCTHSRALHMSSPLPGRLEHRESFG